MKILKPPQVDQIPKNCTGCLFWSITNPEDCEGWVPSPFCKLKIWMEYKSFGITTKPCPLDGRKKEL
jgi:hypothetical protein